MEAGGLVIQRFTIFSCIKLCLYISLTSDSAAGQPTIAVTFQHVTSDDCETPSFLFHPEYPGIRYTDESCEHVFIVRDARSMDEQPAPVNRPTSCYYGRSS